MAQVFITRTLPDIAEKILREVGHTVVVAEQDGPLPREDFLQGVADADAVITLLTDKVDGDAMDAAGSIKGFANYAVGFDNMDVPAATERGIPLSNTPGVLTSATAEMAWALLFAASRRVVESDGVMRSGKWPGWGPLQFIGGDVAGRTLGIVGAGRIGAAMAMKSRGFDMPVLYVDENRNDGLEKELGARKVDFDTLVRESDYVSIHVPLMPSTRHLFNRDVFRKMKPTAYLINTARGPVIDEADLVEALRTGEIAGAGLDVYEYEPAMVDGLAGLKNVVVTPHTASATEDSRNGMAELAARNVLAMLNGTVPETCLNPGVFGE
jgi:glyoxylate reductase